MQTTIIIVLSAPELPVLTSSNGINTSAIGIERNAVFCYFQIFHGRFGDLCCFVVTPIRRNLCFFGANICGPICIDAIQNAFSISDFRGSG